MTRIETGRRAPSLSTLARLANALGVPPAALVETSETLLAARSAIADRIASVVDAEPPDVQQAIERIGRTLVSVVRSQRTSARER